MERLRTPVLAADGNHVYVIGTGSSNASVLHPSNGNGNLGLVVMEHHRVATSGQSQSDVMLPSPDGWGPADRVRVIAPVGVVDKDGRLHLMWGSRTADKTELWHAIYSKGEWSAPDRIAAFSEIGWQREFIAVPRLRANGSIAMAVPTYSKVDHGGLVEITWDGGSWHERRLPVSVATTPAYVRLESDDVGREVVVYIAPDPVSRVDQGSVFIMRSGDGGKTWTQPFRLSSSSGRTAIEPFVYSGANGIDVGWVEESKDGSTQFVQSAHANRIAGSWRHNPEVTLRQARDVNTTRSNCGDVTAIFETVGDPLPSLYSMTLQRGNWSTPSPLTPRRFSAAASLLRDARGCVHMLYLSASADSLPSVSNPNPPPPQATYRFACGTSADQ